LFQIDFTRAGPSFSYSIFFFFLFLSESACWGVKWIARGRGQRGHMLNNWADLSINSFHKKTWVERGIKGEREREREHTQCMHKSNVVVLQRWD